MCYYLSVGRLGRPDGPVKGVSYIFYLAVRALVYWILLWFFLQRFTMTLWGFCFFGDNVVPSEHYRGTALGERQV